MVCVVHRPLWCEISRPHATQRAPPANPEPPGKQATTAQFTSHVIAARLRAPHNIHTHARTHARKHAHCMQPPCSGMVYNGIASHRWLVCSCTNQQSYYILATGDWSGKCPTLYTRNTYIYIYVANIQDWLSLLLPKMLHPEFSERHLYRTHTTPFNSIQSDKVHMMCSHN